MKSLRLLPILLILTALASCAPKSYFTAAVRKKLESKNISMEQLQFYVDSEVELRRELASGGATVSGGKVVLENGKYIHIIVLKPLTPGVCVETKEGKLDIAFEEGDDKKLTFGVPEPATGDQIYQIFADSWSKTDGYRGNMTGKITYDGETYYIQGGSTARLMIQKSVINRLNVDKRVMKGRKVD